MHYRRRECRWIYRYSISQVHIIHLIVRLLLEYSSSKVNLPAWMAGQFYHREFSNYTKLIKIAGNSKGSLKALANKLVSQNTYLETRYNGYEIAFDGQNEDEDSWRAKAVVVFLTGSLLEDDLRADMTIVYFLGVRCYIHCYIMSHF